MLTNDGQKPNTFRYTKYKLLELAAHVERARHPKHMVPPTLPPPRLGE